MIRIEFRISEKMYDFPQEIVASAQLLSDDDSTLSPLFMNGYWIATYADYEEGIFNYENQLTYSTYSG